MDASSLNVQQVFRNSECSIQYIVEYICILKQSANNVKAEMDDCLSFQISLFPYLAKCRFWDVCLSICFSVCVTECMFARVSVFFSPSLYRDRPGTLPALCHMISLEAAGVKLIWSGFKPYERLMRRIICRHLNSPLPPLKCPSCSCSGTNILIWTMTNKPEKQCCTDILNWYTCY